MLNRLSLNRIGLNRIGLNRIGKPSGGSSDRPYIDPKVLNSLCGVWIMDQNTNESESRNIIKNKIADRGGDLELLNFAYKANSGYNGYPEDFTSWSKYSNSNNKLGITASKVVINSANDINPSGFIIWLQGATIPEMRIRIKGIKSTTKVEYYYVVDGLMKYFIMDSDGIYNIPSSESYGSGVGFNVGQSVREDCVGLTIEQLPLYEGALVTDGKDDMIVSQKSFIDIVGSDNQPYTIVSMVSFIDNLSTYFNSAVGTSYMTINNIDSSAKDKTGIFGYSTTNVKNTPSVINDILGDKNDYHARPETAGDLIGRNFFIQGYLRDGIPTMVSSVAVYWAFISNKVLTTDEINQIIAYFKLDKYVTPQVIYDVKRQGLTNDTPAADWYLKDFSGNGHDMQLYNYAKKLNSGVGKYEVDFLSWNYGVSLKSRTHDTFLASTDQENNPNVILGIVGTAANPTSIDIESFTIDVKLEGGAYLTYFYIGESDTNTRSRMDMKSSGRYTLPKSYHSNAEINIPCGLYIGGLVGTVEVTQIPDYEGALVSDGIDDYGKVENLPIYKDYTVAIDRAWTNDLVKAQCLTSKLNGDNFGSFSFELIENGFSSYSFGISNKGVITIDSNKKISYQSKYVYNGSPIISGNNVDGKDLFLFRNRDSYPYYAEAAIWSYILFPYTLSEFLLERQLKRYKLGTLYPDMVEFRPIIKSNVGYDKIVFHYQNKDIENGTYLAIGSEIVVYVRLSSSPNNEIKTLTVNGTPAIFIGHDNNINVYQYKFYLSDKSPQKIDITIDEYIRYEDIVQPYPCIINIPKVDGGYYTYGDKIPVGYRFRRESAINLLPELYSLSDIFLNGELCNVGAEIIISKSMVFTANKTWLLDTTEPHAIYSPQKLNIPNSSLKILGYIPDLTGKGNHGKLNNFAYTEDSGVAANGSIKFDGTDDHITIPTLAHGGKCVMMKVNWSNNGMLYDQRLNSSAYTFGIYTGENHPAYNARNNGSTYIDGILNTNIIPSDLVGITHNITAVNDAATDNSTTSPKLGTSFTNDTFSNMSLYEFILFPEIPSEDEIKKLNDVMGIEGGYVESPNYYWDAYGKKNSDTDRNLIADQVSKDVANALEVKNVAYNSESGYTDDNGLLLDGVDDHAVNTVIPAVTDFTVIAKREFPESALVNNQTFLVKGDAINGNNNVNSLVMECYWSDNYVISFQHQNVIPLEESKISWATPTSYNGNVITKGSGVDSAGLAIGRLRELYRKVVFYKLMFYTKTIDQLSINMLKNLFERDELIDVTNPIFKKQ